MATALVAVALAATGLETVALQGSRPTTAETAPAQAQQHWPAGLREAAESAAQAHAYGAHPDGAGGWRAANPAHAMETLFSAAGVQVRPTAGAWSMGMVLAGLGRPGSLAPVGPAAVVAEGQRVEYRRAGLTEWYINDARGLEQGFTLQSPPSGAGGEPLVVDMTVTGDLVPRLTTDGAAVELSGSDGNTALTYGALHAYDAAGKELDSRLAVDGNAVRLEVDDAGAAYPLTIDPVIGTEQAELTPWYLDDPESENFGWAVAVSGDTAVAGAPLDDIGGAVDAGAAYVFVRSGTGWSQQAFLTAFDVGDNFYDHFGWSVAVSGDTVLVGAPDDDTGAESAGSAYVFVRSGTSWNQQVKLPAPSPGRGLRFGRSVAISRDTAVIGARDSAGAFRAGSAYVFVRSGTTWTQQAQLRASDPNAFAEFGSAVAISGDTVMIGAPGNDAGGLDAGSAYVFRRSGTTWAEQARLTATDAAEEDQFGYSVAVSGDTALVGAPFDDGNQSATVDAGSAYVFVRSGTTWAQQAQLLGSLGVEGDQFGYSVAVSGDTAVVGAPISGLHPERNELTYVFMRSGTTWSEQAQLIVPQPGDADVAQVDFGWSVAVSGDTAVVGAPLADTAGTDSGAAYVFVLEPEAGADLGVTKRCDSGPVAPGGVFNCSVTVTNAGPSAAEAVSVSDDLPPSVSLAGPPAGGGFSCGTGDPFSCTLPTLEPARSATFTYTVRVAEGTEPGTALNNTATVSSATSDPDPQNDSSRATTSVVSCGITGSGDIAGTPGADVICGSAGPDRIAGLGGDDIVWGGGGNDYISGGEGNDTISGGDGNDQLSGGVGNDRLTGDGGTDSASGGDGTDTCSAEAKASCEP